eukprot:COSAG01_NODE_2428_length_7717_cov_5.280126_4_plen_45_part_00
MLIAVMYVPVHADPGIKLWHKLWSPCTSMCVGRGTAGAPPMLRM